MKNQLMKNIPALEIAMAISQKIVFNVGHFAKEGTGFSVSAFHHPQGEGSDLDEYELVAYQVEGDSKYTIFTTYVKDEKKSKEVIDLLKNFFPADLIDFN